jgi:hypothetical protein
MLSMADSSLYVNGCESLRDKQNDFFLIDTTVNNKGVEVGQGC